MEECNLALSTRHTTWLKTNKTFSIEASEIESTTPTTIRLLSEKTGCVAFFKFLESKTTEDGEIIYWVYAPAAHLTHPTVFQKIRDTKFVIFND